MSDYEIHEIRCIRHEISAECGHDFKRLADYYRRLENELRSAGRYDFFEEESSDLALQGKAETAPQA